ncbi:MAG: hypothetical protein GC155_13370 [Alphaproteobacteria bacterium]|nr:hypothetical protein [Alphaproteobacteria bacterium]
MTERLDDGYSVLASFSSMEEANIAVAALRAGRVPAIVGNAHSAAVAWTMVPAMGGIQIMVPSTTLEQARALLQERVEIGPDFTDDPDDVPYDPARRKDRWKVRVLLLWVLGPFVLLLAGVLIQGWIRLVMRFFG